ncbi:hypothetical protein [Ktedonobacter robiniae]|uniref:hypothetical protein n=1 Tax=Ktedonobacter robiniae TaxID=2778365 RepID=UPI001915411B|nr:hypothetical protein [Ktedonobacter robiniae]
MKLFPFRPLKRKRTVICIELPEHTAKTRGGMQGILKDALHPSPGNLPLSLGKMLVAKGPPLADRQSPPLHGVGFRTTGY